MNKEIEIPEGFEAKIENNKIIFIPKESKDEKIRKALLRCCDDWEKGQFGCMAKEDVPAIRAYLEKQKEQIVIKQNIIDSIRANTQPDWDFSTIPNLHKEINRFFGEKFILPHTEDTIITVSDVIRCAYHFYKFGQQEQKPAEWSEEDEEMVSTITTTLGTSRTVSHDSYLRVMDWLKSLRPQPRWKPNKEQMDILDKVYHYLWTDRNATADMQDGLGDFIDEIKSL